MTRFVFVAAAFVTALSAVACSNTVEGQNPEPSKTDTAQTQPGSQGTSQGSANGGANGGTESKGDGKSQTCPEIDIPQCAETDELVTGNDENGCSYAYCKPNGCPPIATPMCAAGTTLKYTTDENGCTFATCE